MDHLCKGRAFASAAGGGCSEQKGVAAVEKCEEKAQARSFFGHRNREPMGYGRGQSLPCVKGGAERQRGGGIVFADSAFIMMRYDNPSVCLTADRSR